MLLRSFPVVAGWMRHHTAARSPGTSIEPLFPAPMPTPDWVERAGLDSVRPPSRHRLGRLETIANPCEPARWRSHRPRTIGAGQGPVFSRPENANIAAPQSRFCECVSRYKLWADRRQNPDCRSKPVTVQGLLSESPQITNPPLQRPARLRYRSASAVWNRPQPCASWLRFQTKPATEAGLVIQDPYRAPLSFPGYRFG